MSERPAYGWPPREVHFNPKRARRTERLEGRAGRAQLRVLSSPSMLELAARGPSTSPPIKEVHMRDEREHDLLLGPIPPDPEVQKLIDKLRAGAPRWLLPVQLISAALAGVVAALALARLFA